MTGNTIHLGGVEPYIHSAGNWIKNAVSSIVSTVSGWFGGEYSSARRLSECGYPSGGGSYSGNGYGTNYHYISPNEQASYMSDVEIGQMRNGLGLSGNQIPSGQIILKETSYEKSTLN